MGLLSIHKLQPSETGGTDARRGLDYQDDVAAAFCLEMVASDALLQVQCETYDDITIIWQDDTMEKVEFIQVKKIDLDHLWTIAKLCQRKKGNGSSILEKSLNREGCVEECVFRIVTDIDVKSELDLLRYDRDDSRRGIDTPEFNTLCDSVSKKVGDFKSPKGNDCVHWLHNTYWDVRESREALRNANILELQKSVVHQMSKYLAPDQADKIYDKLLRKVHDTAGPEKRANPNDKIITRDDFLGKRLINPIFTSRQEHGMIRLKKQETTPCKMIIKKRHLQKKENSGRSRSVSGRKAA